MAAGQDAIPTLAREGPYASIFTPSTARDHVLRSLSAAAPKRPRTHRPWAVLRPRKPGPEIRRKYKKGPTRLAPRRAGVGAPATLPPTDTLTSLGYSRGIRLRAPLSACSGRRKFLPKTPDDPGAVTRRGRVEVAGPQSRRVTAPKSLNESYNPPGVGAVGQSLIRAVGACPTTAGPTSCPRPIGERKRPGEARASSGQGWGTCDPPANRHPLPSSGTRAVIDFMLLVPVFRAAESSCPKLPTAPELHPGEGG